MQGKIQPKFEIPTDSIQSPLKNAFPQWGRRRVKNGVSYKIFTGDGANKCATDGRSLIIYILSGGTPHIKGVGMLIGNFELNP